jgi:LysM repeat protein
MEDMTMKRIRQSAVTVLALGMVVLGTPVDSRASSDAAGTTAANFLTVGSGAAAQGRAGATLGLVGDLGSIGWNPASLGFLKETEFALSHATILEDHTQDYISAGGRLGNQPLRWALTGIYASEGSFEGRDALNNPTGSFDVSRIAAGANVAWPINEMLSLGVGGKWVNESLGDARGSGVTFDFGVQMRSGPLGFGIAGQNVLGQMKFEEQIYQFPTNYGAGIAYDHVQSGLRFAVDVNFPNAYYTDVRTGVEYRWRDMAALRLGYRSEMGAPEGETLTGPTFGLGTGFYGMWLDYAYMIPGQAEAQHRIGISLRPGKMSMNQGPFGSAEPGYEAPRATATKTSAPAEPKSVEEAPRPPKSPKAVPPPTKAAEEEYSPPPPPEVSPAPAATPVRPNRVTVRAGETITSIAKRWGVSPEALMMHNDLVSPDVKPGQVLKLPPARK